MFPHTTDDILRVLDCCAGNYSFPMLDNGYVYLAATRLALFRSEIDWALTIEVFGFSPRCGTPDLYLGTFASSLVNRKQPSDYVNEEAYRAYLERQPNDESQFLSPLDDGDWIDNEHLSVSATHVTLRGRPVPIPPLDGYRAVGVELTDGASPSVFEFCRWLAALHRGEVLATEAEQRHNVPDSLVKIMQLDDWHHPDTAAGEAPSDTETFRQLAEVLATGDLRRYHPREPMNTHWKNWPEGGTL